MPCSKFSLLTKTLVLLICFAPSHISIAQSTNDTIPASKYFSKAESLLAKWKLDSAIVYYQKAQIIFEEAGTKNRIADAYDKIAESYRKNYDLDDALNHAKKALAIRIEMFGIEHPEVALSYNSLGHILKERDQFQDAMDYYQKALTIQLSSFGDKNHLVADCYHNVGTVYHVLAEYDNALINYNKSLEIRTVTFGKRHQKIADSYIDLATTYYHLGKFQVAIEYYQKALTIRASIYGKKSPEVAFCYNHIGEILNLLDKFDQALEYQEKALFIISNIFGVDHPNTALCYKYIGISHRFKGNIDTASQNYNKALLILIKKLGEKNTKIADIYIEIGLISIKKGWYNQSLKYYNKTLAIEEKVFQKKHSYIGSVSSNIGLTHTFKGEYDKALIYYKKAITNYIYSLGENHGAVARTYNNIANVYKAKEEYDLAVEYYQKALKIRTNILGGNHSDTSASYHDIGDLYVSKLDFTNALLYYQKALNIQLDVFGENHYYTSDIYNSVASIYSKKKEYTIALEHLNKSIKIRLKTDGKHHPRTAKSYNQIAYTQYQLKNYKKALLYFEKAITANAKPNNNSIKKNKFDPNQYLDLTILLNTFHNKAKIIQQQFEKNKHVIDLDSCIAIYRKADVLIQNIQQIRNNYQDKLAFAKQTQQVYADAIQAQLLYYKIIQDKQSFEQAFYYAEKSKANVLKTLLKESKAREFAGLPNDILKEEQKLRSERAFYISEITNQRISENSDSLKIIQYENELFDVEKKQDSLIQLLEKDYPKYYQLKHQNSIVSVTDIQEQLDDKTILLEFFTSNNITYAFTISKNNFNVKELKTLNLKEKIEAFRKTITLKNLASYSEQAYDLYITLIDPIKEELQGDQLIIIPDGSLWHLNFDLLLTNQNYNQDNILTHPKEYPFLLKDYAISYANSANLLFGLNRNNPNTPLKSEECLAFSFSDSATANSSNDISFSNLRSSNIDLPGTRKEIKAISSIIDGQYYYGSKAIETNFKKNADRYNILHLALHGEVDNERPENSKLYFTKSKDTLEDNILYSHELFALNIPAELTVLSACNTGSGKIAKGEGIMSLGTAFQYAGTKSLLLTNWEVSDETTPQLMQYFYTNLKAGLPKNKALQQAKLQYLNNKEFYFLADPFYWGGLYLVGDITPIRFGKDNSQYWIVILIVGICTFLYKRIKYQSST